MSAEAILIGKKAPTVTIVVSASSAVAIVSLLAVPLTVTVLLPPAPSISSAPLVVAFSTGAKPLVWIVAPVALVGVTLKASGAEVPSTVMSPAPLLRLTMPTPVTLTVPSPPPLTVRVAPPSVTVTRLPSPVNVSTSGSLLPLPLTMIAPYGWLAEME